MGFRRRTRRRAVIAGAAVAHHETKKHEEQQQAQSDDGNQGVDDQLQPDQPDQDQPQPTSTHHLLPIRRTKSSILRSYMPPAR